MARLTKQRRQQIRQAATEVIAERGLCETRLADIAKRAGVSPGLPLYYFGSKDVLLTEALTFAEERFYREISRELDRLEGAPDRLVRLIDLAFPPAVGGATTSDWVLWFELWSRSVRDPEVARKRRALDRRWRQTIADVVRDGQASGEFADVDAEEFAVRLAALMDGLAIQAVLRDPSCPPDRVRHLSMEAAARELGFDPTRVGAETGVRT